MTQRLRLTDEKRAARLLELTDDDSPTNLESEIATMRLIAEEALNEGQARLAIECAKVIGQLSSITETTSIRRGELLAKTAVLSIVQQLVTIMAESIEGRFTGWEDTMDGVRQKFITVVAEAQNPDSVE